MINLPEIFGSMVFNDKAQRAILPKAVYLALRKTIEESKALAPDIAQAVANAMRIWAIDKGATHYTHWFQPMTGITAEKHESFISPLGRDGVIMEFGGSALIRGEPDASSFPSGGLRATFEARGYTAWDPTSYAFVKDGVLCIPTAFCSYSGESLDKKTPLLRSMDALNKQALRVLRLFGDDAKRVTATVGAEQEFFLLDAESFNKRPDLVNCGRTLIGTPPEKGQELDDHYYGSLKPRIAAYLKDLDMELWKLGILAKTQHNEVAPSQHELASVYTTVNISADQNQLTMEVMKSVATSHGLRCILHEKPFAGLNGSGKHVNWSLSTDDGDNLLEPGETPHSNARFLLFMVAVIEAVDKYGALLRASAHGAGNDHRLGGNEAPPGIVSIYLGDELTDILNSIADNKTYKDRNQQDLTIGIEPLPSLRKDSTDRNRTSPMAFTGNKFEFRMVGSSSSISGPSFILNTMVADVLASYADALENEPDFMTALRRHLSTAITKHRRIIFNGNNYDDKWQQEAQVRGLPVLSSTVPALSALLYPEHVALFERQSVLSQTELSSRHDILINEYLKRNRIEAATLLSMVNTEVLPSCFKYQAELAELACNKSRLDIDNGLECAILTMISQLCKELIGSAAIIEEMLSKEHDNLLTKAEFYKNKIVTQMEQIREVADKLESICAKSFWPYPSYRELLYSV